MHLLIAGYGFLGAELSKQAREQGWKVSALSRSESPETLTCDITDLEALKNLNIEPTTFIHCASSGRGGGIDRYQEVYLQGIKNLIQAFPLAHPVFTSSTSVYGQTDGSVVTEDSSPCPSRDTGKILLQAEQVCLDAGGSVGRLAGLYGPRRSFTLKKFLAGETVIEGDGARWMNQIHRDDAASALLHLIKLNTHGVFNVCDDRPLSQLDCYTGLSEMLSLPFPPSGPRKLDSKRGWSHKAVSNDRLKALGWAPEYSSFLDAAPHLLDSIEKL